MNNFWLVLHGFVSGYEDQFGLEYFKILTEI